MEIKYDITITQKARKDLNKIFNYISNELKEKETANKMLNTIKKHITILHEAPEGFSVVNFYNKKKYEYRKLIVKNYIVIYRIDKKKKIVYIVKVVYGRKNYLNE